jgi:A/G-specific adenine glycosylase
VNRDDIMIDDLSVIEDLRVRLLRWYADNRRDLPWRRTQDPYAILVSEVMLQQTQVLRVVPKYREFLARFPDLGVLAGASLADVLAVWSGLGYNNRAVRLKRAAEAVVAQAAATDDTAAGGGGGGARPPPARPPPPTSRIRCGGASGI